MDSIVKVGSLKFLAHRIKLFYRNENKPSLQDAIYFDMIKKLINQRKQIRQAMKPQWMLPFLIVITSIFLFLTNADADRLERPLSFQHITQKEGLSSEMVYAIAVQGEEVWFGTYGGGATLFDKSKNVFRAYTTKGEPMEKVDDGKSIKWKNLLSYNHVSVILPDEDRIWFGTYFYGYGGGGISYYDLQRNPPWKRFNTNNNRAKKINSMAVDGGSLWVGSEQGLSLLDKKTESWKRFYSTEDGLSGNFVNAILAQPDSVWIGTNGGISRLDKMRKTWKTYSQKEGLAEIEIKSIVKVRDWIWAGGIDGTLFRYDPVSDRWKKIEPADSLKNGEIHSMTVTKERVFICRDNGVSVYDFLTSSWESLTTSDGLLSNTVFCAAEDKNSIWFGTDRGASRLLLRE